MFLEEPASPVSAPGPLICQSRETLWVWTGVGVGSLGTYPNGDIDVEGGYPLPRTHLSSQSSLWHMDAGVPYEVSLSTMPVKNIDERLPFLTCRLVDL